MLTSGSFGTDVWDGEIDISWYNPNLTEFRISTAEQLAGLAKLVNDGTDNFHNKKITLGANLDLAGKEWTPIGIGDNNFQGTLFDDGGGTIANLTITGEDMYITGSSVRFIHPPSLRTSTCST